MEGYISNKNIVVYGASGHGKVVAELLFQLKSWNVVGFIDDEKEVEKIIIGHCKVIGNSSNLKKLVELHNISSVVVAIGDNYIRRIVVEKIKKLVPNVIFPVLVHPRACISFECYIDEGTVLLAGSCVGVCCKIGKFCLLNSLSSIDHDNIMGDFSSLAPGAITGGNVTIGENTAICMGSSVRHNIKIGEYVVVGMGSIVIKNIGDQLLVYGSPISVIKQRNINDKYL